MAEPTTAQDAKGLAPVSSSLEYSFMKSETKSAKLSIAAFLFSTGSMLLYELLTDAKLCPFSIQFKFYALGALEDGY